MLGRAGRDGRNAAFIILLWTGQTGCFNQTLPNIAMNYCQQNLEFFIRRAWALQGFEQSSPWTESRPTKMSEGTYQQSLPNRASIQWVGGSSKKSHQTKVVEYSLNILIQGFTPQSQWQKAAAPPAIWTRHVLALCANVVCPAATNVFATTQTLGMTLLWQDICWMGF